MPSNSPRWAISARSLASMAPAIIKMLPQRRRARSFKADRTGDAALSGTYDPAFRRLLMYLLVGTKGGKNRSEIIRALKAEPMNMNQLSEKLSLDYKTVQHHIRILEENKVIVPSSPKGTYGAMYFLSPYMERHSAILDEIRARFGKR